MQSLILNCRQACEQKPVAQGYSKDSILKYDHTQVTQFWATRMSAVQL